MSLGKPRFGVLTGITIILLGLFGVVDAGAHFTKYQYGETFSAFFWGLEKRFPLVRVIGVLGGLILATHLGFGIP